MNKVFIEFTRVAAKEFYLGIVCLGLFLASFLLVVFAGDLPRKHCTLVPQTWTPSLNQVGEYLIEFKTEAQSSQQALNQVSQNLADVRDAQLFITYIRLIQALDAKEQSHLFEEQKRWLAKRDESARATVISKGGSLAPLEYSGTFRKITEERLAELQQRLKQSTSTIQDK